MSIEPEIVDMDPVPDELLDGEVVLEAGAYEGAWVLKVCEQREGCAVFAFEPASRAYKVAKKNLQGYTGVDLRNIALGKQSGTAVLCDRNRDGANTHAHNPEHEPSETVQVVDIAEIVAPLGEIALAHLNAEGDETAILERLIETGQIERFKRLLVQWHPYDTRMQERIAAIVLRLSHTHIFERRGAWGCWIRKDQADGK